MGVGTGPRGSAVAEVTPRQRIEAACARLGRGTVVAACIELLAGADGDGEMVTVLGGPHAVQFVHSEHRSDQHYWLRVWAARGLLWAWDDAALPALSRAMSDDAWRVREMCCKVVARHRLDEMFPQVIRLRDDPVERVSRAASRAVIVLTGAGA